MKFKSKLLKICALLLVLSFCLVSIAFGWYAENKQADANGLKVSTEEITDDGVISTDGNSEKTYKIHQEINSSLKATKDFTNVKIKFEVTKLNETNYKAACQKNLKYIRSDYLKNNIIYKPTTLEDELDVMWKLYDNNDVIDYYQATLTMNNVSYALQERVDDSNIRVFQKANEDGTKTNASGSSDDTFSIKLTFGLYTIDENNNVTYTYPSYTETSSQTTTDKDGNESSTTTTTSIQAMNYNVFLIGLSLKITFICE